MPPTPIDPYDDPRVTHEFATLNGRKYHYVQGLPKGQEPKATILCIHGFPDLWYSWRYIIPALIEMGLRVIVPEMIGYGQTDQPKVPPNTLEAYSMKSSANDMAELLKQLNIPKVILLGHDWGGVVVQRIYFWHPQLVSHLITICTPYSPPMRSNPPMEEVVKVIPTFVYQIAFQNPQTEKDIQTKEDISRFMRAFHRGVADGPSGIKFQVRENLMENLGDQPRGKLMSEKDLEYYVNQYAINGMHGPLNWYKTREVNYLDEKDLEKETIDVPVLYVGAEKDSALPPSMAANQGKYIPNLTTKLVSATHWVMVEVPDDLISILDEWLKTVVFNADAHKL